MTLHQRGSPEAVENMKHTVLLLQGPLYENILLN